MPDVVLTPGVLPQPQCYADEQSRFEAYVAAIITSLTGGLQWTASTTAPTDLTQYWLRTDTSNPGDPTYARGLEILKWSVPDAAWVRVFSVPSSTGVIGGVVNSFTLTHTPPYITAASAYRVGQVYVFIANAAITGAVTLNVDGLGAKAIKKRVSLDLAAGDILEDQMVSVIFDGTNFQMLSDTSNVDLSYFPEGEFGEVLKTVGPYPALSVAWDSVTFSTVETFADDIAEGAKLTIPHDFGVVPGFLELRWKCEEPDGEYVKGQEIPNSDTYLLAGGGTKYSCYADATNIYILNSVSTVAKFTSALTGAYLTPITLSKWYLYVRYAR